VYLKGTDQTKANSEVSVNITAIFHSANGQNSGQKGNQNSRFLLFLKISNKYAEVNSCIQIKNIHLESSSWTSLEVK